MVILENDYNRCMVKFKRCICSKFNPGKRSGKKCLVNYFLFLCKVFRKIHSWRETSIWKQEFELFKKYNSSKLNTFKMRSYWPTPLSCDSNIISSTISSITSALSVISWLLLCSTISSKTRSIFLGVILLPNTR